MNAEPAFMSRIRLRARRRVQWMRRVWAAEGPGGGLAISAGEVDRILTDPAALVSAEQAFHAQDPEMRGLADAIAGADRAVAADPTLSRLRRELGLDDVDVDLLTLAVAVEDDPGLRRMCGYLHDDATLNLPTPWLAQQLFEWPAGTRVGADAGLIRWRLARPVDPQANPWSLLSPWFADPELVRWLRGGAPVDPLLRDAVRLMRPAIVEADACLYPTELAALRQFVDALSHEGAPPIELVIAGPAGAGKRTLAADLCANLLRPLLIADTAALMGADLDAAVAVDAAIRAVRTARLAGAAIYWHDAHLARPAVWREVAGRAALALYGVTSAAATAFGGDRVAHRAVRLPALTRAARFQLWSRLSDADVPRQVLDWPLLPSAVVRAAAVVDAGEQAVIDACRATLRIDAASLASPLPRPYGWDDLVLQPTVARHLEEILSQARLRWPVYEEWGFGRLCPMGRGIAALFAGPSGTGKTMAAQVLAAALGMEIYRVDLAGVMSKYIGETEKNLRQVFDACERANVLLFFDEADALFGQRTQVKDAHDRFANIEIDYLLQRMEQFDGIAILATNRRGDLDTAFMRRIRFIVDFLPPGIPERRKLWTKALPETIPGTTTPLIDNLDWDVLARKLDLTGAEIKAAALGAAFLARKAHEPISMSHVLHAARRELAKRGVTVRAGELEGVA